MFSVLSMNHRRRGTLFGLTVATLFATASLSPASAAPLAVVNHGFEDITGQTVFNEFTFGTPAGWVQYDPNGLIDDVAGFSGGFFPGTLQPNGVDFFSQTAPEGDRVAILFNEQATGGAGEYGFEQTLSATLQANTNYTLTVEVGDIDSGVATNGAFFDLEGFPGYRIDLLAGGAVIASDNNSLAGSLIEGIFSTATVSIDIGAAHAALGQNLGIRLVNLNNPQGPSDLEVDFDDVQLTATEISEPGVVALAMLGILAIGLGRVAARRRQAAAAAVTFS